MRSFRDSLAVARVSAFDRSMAYLSIKRVTSPETMNHARVLGETFLLQGTQFSSQHEAELGTREQFLWSLLLTDIFFSST